MVQKREGFFLYFKNFCVELDIIYNNRFFPQFQSQFPPLVFVQRKNIIELTTVQCNNKFYWKKQPAIEQSCKFCKFTEMQSATLLILMWFSSAFAPVTLLFQRNLLKKNGNTYFDPLRICAEQVSSIKLFDILKLSDSLKFDRRIKVFQTCMSAMISFWEIWS